MDEALKLVPPALLSNPVIFTEQTPNSEAMSRLWKECLLRHGVKPEQIETVTVNINRRSMECHKYVRVYCRNLMRRIILSTTDGLAYNLIEAFMLENFQPGKDFHLIRCGNREAQGFRFADEPMITSIGVPEDKVINEAVKLLLRLIEEPSDCIYHIRIPSELVIRKSFTGSGQS